ncbi:hypothetical protein I4Q36_05915 [Tuanshanicoccus lijuaniae]|uniref:YozE family protein n=1 Tax=Aerococcaceae bacterium zg-1292 TaxID=2774330 RepID=UPI00193833EE|nr:hypothetical protein [Aerococcaceae bacterium zg-1292]MBF6625582.1 hypothetical protein [Aerococcaceae bacterium zg-BR9]MBF6977765.1 hypothetical protein [Aerococcaceae bacterium zg-BR22]MBS4456542.1 hypothetical protein [Aerococcaceae bacterium zg-A91]MBS4458706.1 hypothetical protein [Aerococcaceae bacterium zg-BR33]
MSLSFYQYIQKFTNHEANDPMSRLANAIHKDHGFPKHTTDFEKITEYMESSSHYTKLLSIFDEAWSKYQWDLE